MENKYFLHRITHHAEISYPLLERNMLSIGWLDFEISHGADSFEKDYEDMYGDSPQ